MPLADNLLAFTLAATLLTVTPGLDTVLVLRTAAAEGRRDAIHAALGINVGCLVWGAAVAFGLGALLAVSELGYTLLKYCGAAYLGWLGLNLLLRPRDSLERAVPRQRKGSGFVRGQPLVAWTFALVGIHVVLSLIWSAILITATHSLGDWLRRERVIRWLDRTTGVVFLLFAARLALSRR